MNYSVFKREIERGKIRPAYLFVGEEDFLGMSGVQSIIDKALQPDERTLNLMIFYGQDAEGLPEALSALPIFATRRVNVVREAQDLKGRNLEAVLRYLEILPEDGCLILHAGKVDKRKSLFSQVLKKIDTIDCGKLRSNQLTGWMKDYTSKWGKQLDSEAIGRLTSINWPSLRELAGELERLTLLVGDEEIIRVRDVEELGEMSFVFERWALTDAVGTGDLNAAQKAANNLQYWNFKPTHMVGDLYRMFQNIWLIKWFQKQRKMDRAEAKIGLHSFVFRKYTNYARRISEKALTDGIMRILEADLNIKRGLRQPAQEISLLVLELAQTVKSGSS